MLIKVPFRAMKNQSGNDVCYHVYVFSLQDNNNDYRGRQRPSPFVSPYYAHYITVDESKPVLKLYILSKAF